MYRSQEEVRAYEPVEAEEEAQVNEYRERERVCGWRDGGLGKEGRKERVQGICGCGLEKGLR